MIKPPVSDIDWVCGSYEALYMHLNASSFTYCNLFVQLLSYEASVFRYNSTEQGDAASSLAAQANVKATIYCSQVIAVSVEMKVKID